MVIGNWGLMWVGGVAIPYPHSPIPCEALIKRSCEGVVEDVGGVWDGVRELGRAVLPLELDGVGGVVGIGDVGGDVGDYYGNWGLGIGD